MRILKITHTPQYAHCKQCLIIEGELVSCNRVNEHTMHTWFDSQTQVTINWYTDEKAPEVGLIVA